MHILLLCGGCIDSLPGCWLPPECQSLLYFKNHYYFSFSPHTILIHFHSRSSFFFSLFHFFDLSLISIFCYFLFLHTHWARSPSWRSKWQASFHNRGACVQHQRQTILYWKSWGFQDEQTLFIIVWILFIFGEKEYRWIVLFVIWQKERNESEYTCRSQLRQR